MQAEKYLLTGASGFLGRHIDNYLSEAYKVVTIGRSSDSDVICDLSNSTPKIEGMFDMVIHSAGKAHVIPKTKVEINQFYNVNFIGTQNLCKSLEKIKIKTFVFISTIAVYGVEEGVEISELHNLQGSSPYAKSKIQAELFLQKWCDENEVKLVILRLPLVAGKNSKGNLGAMIKGIKKGYYFNIANNKALKSIVLADDIAKLIPTLSEKNGIYNLSGDKDYSFSQISEIISEQLGGRRILTLPYFFVKIISFIGAVFPFFPLNNEKLKKMMSNLTVSSKKAVKELNWQPNKLIENFKI